MIRLPYGTTESREPVIHVHRFETRDTKTEQRYYAGAGERRLHVSLDNLAPDERTELIDQFAAASGSYLPFNIDLVGPSGSTETLSVRFAVPRLEIQTLIDGSSWASSFDLIVDPGAPPSYTTASTETRFPGASLQAALLSPVQEIIPLLVITTRAAQVHRVSERACTVDGAGYAAKLLEWDGIKQSLYGADQASFTLANADRAFTTIINAQNWHAADVQFSLLHVGTLIKVNLWRGHVIPGGWDLSTANNTLRITAADGAYELRLAYPPRKITRQDGFVTPADHQPVNLGKGKNRLTATSVVHDTGYGKPLKDIWVNDTDAPLRVNCDVIAGRDEKEFYAALGIVGRGPIGNFGAVPIIEGATIYKYGTLDGQPHHGPGLNGLRRSRGGDPATGSETQLNNNPDAGSAILAIDQVGSPLPAQPAPPGAAFMQIRRLDEAGIQPDNATKQHEMIAFVSQGNGGWIWTAGVRSWATAITNNAWVAVNVWLRGNGVGLASQVEQEAYFNVAAAEALAATCATTVPVLVGTGTEEQFRFTGTIEEEKPLRDWLKEILAGCLGYYTFEFGKLKLGSRFHSGSTEAFDSGNILLNSLTLSQLPAEYNKLMGSYADREYGYTASPIEFTETDHVAAIGQQLVGNINFVGVATKSQASRLITTLMRENLGGVDATEWQAARRIGFSTTVLALNVDCGTISSLTHAEMPGGAGEFITETWSLNRDMSIAIEGRTTTDAMYDMVLGNKPVDVPANLPPGSVDKLPGLFLYTPVVKDLGFLTLTNCSMSDGSNRGLRTVTVFLFYVNELEPDNWVTNDSDPGTSDPATFNVTPNGTVVFGVDDYVLFEDPGDYEIDRITAISTPAWTLQRSWPGNDPAEAIFESIRVAHAAGTKIYRVDQARFDFAASSGTFEDPNGTGELSTEFACQISDARVMAVVASVANGQGYSDWVVYNLGAGLSTQNMSLIGEVPPDDVTIDSADYEYIDAYKVRVRIYWSPPAVLGDFIGVHCFDEDPDVSSVPSTPMDSTQAMDGSSNLGGEWAPIDRGRGVVSPFVIEMDAPRVAVTHRFYLAAYSEAAERELVRATEASPTPSITLSIGAPVYQSGVEYAQLVTGVVATVEFDDSQVASPKYRIRFQWAAPSIAPAAWQRGFGGVQIVYEYDVDARRANGPSLAVNETDATSDWYDLYVGTSTIGCWFVSYDNSEEPRLNTIVAGVTPRSDVTFTWPLASRPPEAPYADNVTGFDVYNARYETNGAGQKALMIDWLWTRPAGEAALARWGGAVIFIYLPGDPQAYACTGTETTASGTMEFTDFPATTQLWTFRAISYDNNGNPNTDPQSPITGTPEDDITVTSPTLGAVGTEYTSNVTGPSFTVTALTASDGTTPRRISATFTRPADVTWGGVEIRVYDGATLVAKSSAAASPVAVTIPNPTTSTTYTVKLVSFDVNGQTNTETGSTPQGTVIAGSAAGTLDLTKFAPASSDEFAIVSGKIEIAAGRIGTAKISALSVTAGLIAASAVVAGKIAANAVGATEIIAGSISSAKLDATEINVGGGGSKPGKFGVYNAAGSQIGFIGVESGNEGGWFKTLRVGGSSYANGIVRADSSGNVTIDGATFALTLNGTKTELANVYDFGLLAGLRVVLVSDTTHRVNITPEYFGIFVGGGAPFHAYQTSGNGYLSVSNSGTSVQLAVDTASGFVNLASMELRVNGTRVVSSRGASVTTVGGTAGGTYTATEQNMLNALETAVNAVISRMQAHGLIS